MFRVYLCFGKQHMNLVQSEERGETGISGLLPAPVLQGVWQIGSFAGLFNLLSDFFHKQPCDKALGPVLGNRQSRSPESSL